MTGEESELDFCFEMFAHTTKFLGHKVVSVGQYNGQKLDKQYEVLLVQGGLLLGGDRHEGDF